MSGDHTLESIVAEAKRKESMYDWPHASELYAKAGAHALTKEDVRGAGRFQEKAGSCLYRFAMQAGSKEDFRERMRESICAYEKAHCLYANPPATAKPPRQLRCAAVLKYIGYWLASEPSQRKKLLDECLELEDKALAAFLESGELQEYRETYATLWLVFFCRVFLEGNRNTLKTLLEKGLTWGRKAIERVQESDDLSSTAAIYLALATCLSDAGFYLVAESENTDTTRLEAVNYLNEALKLSERASDGLHAGLCHLWLGINSGGEEAEGHHKKAFEYGQLTSDGFLIANSLDYLAYVTYWKTLTTEDPQRRIETAKEAMHYYEQAMHHYSVISFLSPRGGFIGPPSGQAEHYYQLTRWKTDAERLKAPLAKSEAAGLEALKVAEEADMPLVIANVKHVLAKTLQCQSYAVSDVSEKRRFLARALEHRESSVRVFDNLMPFFYWNRGVMRNYLSEIETELADVEPDSETKRRLLETAVQDKEDCLELLTRVMPYLERKGETNLYAALHNFQDSFSTMLIHLHDLTKKPLHLRKAVGILRAAIRSAEKLDMVARLAESYWKIGKVQDRFGEHRQAAESFERAAENYVRAAMKIPPLSDFYQDHATYMRAWSEIEKARESHASKQYGKAQTHYQKAADLHQSTRRWHYLTPNYAAWADLEAAEDQSRRELIREAKLLFQKAAALFQEAKHILANGQPRVDNLDEQDLARRLTKASDIRYTYCLGRLALEEAKILGRQGENVASAAKYGLAAKRFQSALDAVETESAFTDATVAKDRQELTPIIYLCRAWQTMKKAEAQASPQLFLKASQLFDNAKEESFDEETKLLALGHSHFCKALGLGTEFEDTREESLYLSATQHIESAANYYVRAGFKVASEYAVATQRLLDAYVYMTNANKEPDPTKKTKYFVAAEKLLQTSIGAYLKAKHPAKSKQVQRLLEKIREERVLATSLGQILDVPTIISSTASFLIPTPSEEAAVGLERFESGNIEATVVAPTKKTSVGDDFNVAIQISNVSNQSILLDKIGGLLQRGLSLITKPGYCDFENFHLRMNGRRLGPLKTEEIPLVMKGSRRGAYRITPKIQYVDETGRHSVSELKPLTIDIAQVLRPQRVTTGYESLDDGLLGGIPEKYAVIVTSSYYDELDSLVRNFLVTGIRAEPAQITFHLTTRPTDAERYVEESTSNLYVFICNPQAEAGLERSPNVTKLKGVENLTEINIAVTSMLRRIVASQTEPRRCCIQILSDVLLQHKALQTRKWLGGLIPELKSHSFTILAVIDPGMHSSEEVRAILDLFDGEVTIHETADDARSLRIKRMRDSEYLDSEIPVSRHN
jgi:hypothetical protein